MAEFGYSILIMLLLLLIKSGSSHEVCEESCGFFEPSIRFPFQLVKGTQDKCTYPGFCLYCTEDVETMLMLPTTSDPIEFRVLAIDYESPRIDLVDPENCFPKKFLTLNRSSFQPYRLDSLSESKIAFFNCASVGHRRLRNSAQSFPGSQDMISCPIYISYSEDSLLELDLVSCTKMFDVNASITVQDKLGYRLSLSWPKPNCTECEAKGKKCKWKNNGTKGEIECFHCHEQWDWEFIQVAKCYTVAVIGLMLLKPVTEAFFRIYFYFRKKKEDQVTVEKFLEDYRAEKPSRFSYADVKRITSGFKEELGEGAHGTVFKGKLSNEILVAVKMLNNNTEGEGKEFINEVGIMGKIHHFNVVRLLGFCAEGIHRALVYNLFPNGSLQSFIFSADDKDHFLGWEKLQQIGIGIAKGIEYLHQGCNHPILHLDINPHNVLLDDNFTPKISDFGLAKLCSKNLSVVSMTAARGTLGYMAPEVFSRTFGNVSSKGKL